MDDGWRLETSDCAADDGGGEGREMLTGWIWGLTSLGGVDGEEGGSIRD